jgi:hypothetical protein
MMREKNMYVQICAIREGQLVEKKRQEKKSTCRTWMVRHFFLIHMVREIVLRK